MNLLLGCAAGALALWGVYALLPTCWFKLRGKLGGSKQGGVFLTFDDGPHPYYTNRLLDLLTVQEVQATFFLLAENAARYPLVVQRMVDEGHQVALHGATHENYWFMGPTASRASLRESLSVLQAQGQQPRYFRPPYGNLNLSVLREAKRLGLTPLPWDVMVQDWRAESTVAGLVEKLQERVERNSVICLHDNSAGSAAPGAPDRMIEALHICIPDMKRRGYRFAVPREGGWA